MAKKIFITNEIIKSICTKPIYKIGYIQSKLINLASESDDRKAILYFNEKAYIKMRALVDTFDTEVQWHGLVKRVGDKSKSVFKVVDIIVPPHKVTSTTVTSNQEKFDEWIQNLTDDTLSKLKMHGHSHVNMNTTPSSVDNNYRSDLISTIGNPTPDTDLFYIFLITNKKCEVNIEIYDIQNNALYESNDITMDVIFKNGSTLSNFFENEVNKQVEKESVLSHKHKGKNIDKDYQYPYNYQYNDNPFYF